MDFVEEQLLFDNDDMDDILLTIDPTDIEDEPNDNSIPQTDTDTGSYFEEVNRKETPINVKNMETTPEILNEKWKMLTKIAKIN